MNGLYSKQENGVLRPTDLAIALQKAYKAIGLKLDDPSVRKRQERELQQIAQGKPRQEVYDFLIKRIRK